MELDIMGMNVYTNFVLFTNTNLVHAIKVLIYVITFAILTHETNPKFVEIVQVIVVDLCLL
jgi:hypothetical protein